MQQSAGHPSPQSVWSNTVTDIVSESRAFIIVHSYKAVVYRRHTSHSAQNAQIHATIHAHRTSTPPPFSAARRARKSHAPLRCPPALSRLHQLCLQSARPPSPEPRHCASASLQSAVRTSQTPGPSAHPEPARTPPPAPHPTRAQGCALITIVWPRPRCPKR